jgi:glycosyltransferase involved in cell wall biosynthesis
MKPTVSVILPVYNGARYLAEAVASVASQNDPHLELIIVDDGSTDETPELIRSFGSRVRAIRQDNAGPGAARNHGLRHATGEFIRFIDADDLWPEGSLALLLRHMEARPGDGFAAGKLQRFRQKPDGGYEFEPSLFLFVFGCGLFRRQVFETAGPINETLRLGEDIDWFLKARECGIPHAVLDDVTVFYRRHAHNTTSEPEESRKSLAVSLKLSLDRRRKSGSGLLS